MSALRVEAEPHLRVLPRQPENSSIITRTWQGVERDPDKSYRRAYSIGADIHRYHQLSQVYDETTARHILMSEVAQDLETYFAELSCVRVMSYRYLIDNQGQLVEDSPAQTPIKDMMSRFSGVDSFMWTATMIPMLEVIPVGASACCLSVRREGEVVEGFHDYLYYFSKIDEATISCYGIELNLTKAQSVAILNTQIGYDYLSESDSWQKLRAQSFYYPPGRFTSPAEAIYQLLDKSLDHLPDDLKTPNNVANYIASEISKLTKEISKRPTLIVDLVEGIIQGQQESVLQAALAQHEQEVLVHLYPELVAQALAAGQTDLVLPCGLISLSGLGISGFDMSFTSGNNFLSLPLIETGEGFNCPNCGHYLKAGNGNVCKQEEGGCGMTKDKWAQISGQTKCA